MKETLARNISIYRKEKGLTQEELAKKLGLSFQAVSKWENAQSMPDLTLLPQLSRIFPVVCCITSNPIIGKKYWRIISSLRMKTGYMS